MSRDASSSAKESRDRLLPYTPVVRGARREGPTIGDRRMPV